MILGVFRQEPTKENTPMALSESALSELRAAIDVGQGGDLIHHLAEWALQQLMALRVEAGSSIRDVRWGPR